MTFQRSAAGQSNQALFYDVDFVVYVESRKMRVSAPSFDEIFWGEIISRCRPDLRIRTKPSGSKTDLLPVAASIIEGSIQNILVCLDRDFECFYRTKFEHPRILYTYGYSWENDVFDFNKCIDQLEDACAQTIRGQEAEHSFLKDFQRLCLLGKRIGRYDVALQLQGFPLQNKAKFGDLIDITTNKAFFSVSRAASKLRELVSKGLRVDYLSVIEFDFVRDYHGKTLIFASYHLVKNSLASYGSLANFSVDLFVARMLKDRIKNITTCLSEVASHHQRQCLAIS